MNKQDIIKMVATGVTSLIAGVGLGVGVIGKYLPKVEAVECDEVQEVEQVETKKNK